MSPEESLNLLIKIQELLNNNLGLAPQSTVSKIRELIK